MTRDARATPFALPLRTPLRIAGAAIPARFGALIEVDGGCGEAVASPGATPPDRIPAGAMRAALAAAVLDAEARAARVPLATLLGGVRRRRIPLNGLLVASDPGAAAAEAAAWISRGVRCLKLKLAPDDLDGDRRRLAAVRAAVGGAVALRVDANAVWTVEHAIAALRTLAELDLEYAEQPVAGIEEMAAVRRAVPVPIAADEAVADADSVERVIAAGAADVIVIKPAWIGLRESVDIARRAHAAGLAVTVTSALDSSIGIAAAAHVAATIAGPLRACGLATAELLAGDLVKAPLPIVDGAMAISEAVGLGVEVDRSAVARFQIAAGFDVATPPPARRRSASPAGTGPAATLAERAARYGDRVALVDATRTLTFAELLAEAAAVAARLDAAGVRGGDHVGLLLADRLAFAVWLHGVAHRGAVAVPLGERLTAAELEQQLGTCACRALVFDRDTAARAAAVPTTLAGARLDADAIFDRGHRGAVSAAPFDAAAPHSVVFTSGSSGAPKPVTLTAGNHYWSAIGSALALGLRDDDRWLACLPLHHVGGLAMLMRGLVSGISVLLHPRFDAAAVNEAIDHHGVTRISLVPTMLQRVLAARGARPLPPTLRTVLLGGAAAPRALLDDCARRGVPVITTYGMTEAASQIAVAGRPLCGVAVRVHRNGAAVDPGEIGGIEVTGPVVSPGQLGADGWLATRDLGRLDAEGRLEVVGRADDVIITGGENVHPREVEQVLESHAAVAEACAFGLPDPLWGEIVAAWVRPRGDTALDASALAAHARAHLAAGKVPRRLTVVGDFPRSAAGKILRRAVRAAASR